MKVAAFQAAPFVYKREGERPGQTKAPLHHPLLTWDEERMKRNCAAISMALWVMLESGNEPNKRGSQDFMMKQISDAAESHMLTV